MKRLLAFVLLVALGIVALRYGIGDEAIVRGGATQGENGQPAAPDPRRTNVGGIEIRQGTLGAKVSQSGALTFPRWRNVDEGNGRVRKEQVFVLDAADSNPIGDGLQQLDGVVVRIFDRNQHAATLTADRAFVELRPDAAGKPSVDEGKDIDLRLTVLTTIAGSRLAGLRLELGDVKVRVEANELVMTTAPDQAVRMTMAGERTVTLRGKGARARLPQGTEVAPRLADVEILAEPVLEADGMVVTAKGRLHWVEDEDAGTSRITLDERVALDLASGSFRWPGTAASPDDRPSTATSKARGDQFVGWLVRDQSTADEREQQGVHWRQLVLTGAPATVELPDLQVTTKQLTVLPGLGGEPFLIAAHGGESHVEQRALPAGKDRQELVTGTAQHRIHLARPGQLVGSIHRALGFPSWAMRPLAELQVTMTEGPSRFDSVLRTVEASDGLHVFAREAGAAGIVRGFGTVAVTQRAKSGREHDLAATGNSGFDLRLGPTEERLQLGPASGDTRGHRFTVRYGDATLQGNGACVAERLATRSQVRLVSPDASIHTTMASRGLDLRGVHQLLAEFEGDELRALDVAGWPNQLGFLGTGETISARAPRILQIGPASFRLLPADDATPSATWSGLASSDHLPSVRQVTARTEHAGERSLEVRGPCLDLHHVGGRTATLDAQAVGNELPWIFATIGYTDGREATTIASSAERLRVLPFLLSPLVRQWHSGHPVGILGEVTLHAPGSPWLLLDHVRSFELDDTNQGHVTGAGRRLLVSHGNRAALFVGDPDALEPAWVQRTHEGRSITMRGARVRIFDDEGGRLDAFGSFADRSTFLPPTITLHEAERAGPLSHMQATCHGNIEVRSDAIAFLGPVAANALHPDGRDDPDGIHLNARELHLQRSDTNKIVGALAKDVVVDWTRLAATCAEIELDLIGNNCIAKGDPEAIVKLPDGVEVKAPRVEVNWQRRTMSTADGRIEQRVPREGSK